MNAAVAREWLPVIRDYALLTFGLGLGVYGIIINSAALSSTGFGLAGAGAIGRASQNGKKKEAT